MASSLPNIDAPVAPGDVLVGKYRVERILGQGGMGVVVAARHIELGELFAIKFLLPTAAYYPEATERFLREARASARLKGEHVAKVHDVGRLPDGRPYMVLEYLAGKDLDDVVRERGPLPVTEAVTYVLQACEAIAEAHEHGIVHRDLKPANLFVTRRPNGTAAVKVLDFGISRQLEPENPEHPGLTKPGVILGTPYYMSPEQMRQSKDADPRSDIWALGCVLYELLTGAAPFHSEVFTELVAMVLQEEPRPPSAHRTDIPPSVEAAVMRCLEKRKERRFQSVQELAAALRSAVPDASQPALSAISIAPPAAMVAVTGRSLGASTTPGWGTQSAEGIHVQPKSRSGLVVGALVALGALIGGGAWLALPARSTVPAKAPAEATQAAVTPSIAAPSTFGETAPSVATVEPAPSGAPTAVASAAAPPPAPQPKPSNPGHVAPATSARPAAPKPTAEPAVPPSEKKKRNTMY